MLRLERGGHVHQLFWGETQGLRDGAEGIALLPLARLGALNGPFRALSLLGPLFLAPKSGPA
jgi:hypothetical protein